MLNDLPHGKFMVKQHNQITEQGIYTSNSFKEKPISDFLENELGGPKNWWQRIFCCEESKTREEYKAKPK